MKLNIAIIDNDALFRKSIAASVDKWAKKSKISAAVNEYSSAEAFLFAYEEKKDYDLLLLDIEMAGISGVEMAERIRREDETIQIVFITGYPEYMCRGYDLSALHYLLKPVSDEKLSEVLGRAMKNIKKAIIESFSQQTEAKKWLRLMPFFMPNHIRIICTLLQQTVHLMSE